MVEAVCGIEVRDALKLTNMVLAGFGNRKFDLKRLNVQDEDQIADTVGGVEREVLDFGKLFCESDEQEFSLGGG